MTRNKLRVGDTDNPTGNLHLSQKHVFHVLLCFHLLL